jgi:predicted nucleotidyltransferase
MTMPAQAALIDRIHRVLEADSRVDAAWLSGSFGKGDADDFSDVDVLVLVQEPWNEVAATYARDGAAIAPPALVNPLFGGRVLSVVTMDWERFDLSFVGPGDLDRYDRGALTPLFNRTGAEPPRRERRPYEPPPEKIAGMIREFLRLQGLTPVVLGREEYVLSVSGVELMRRALIDLMIEDNRIAPEDRGGALHLRRLLTSGQLAALERFPPLRPDRESALAGHLAAAALYLPLARRLAEETGAEWPAVLEEATRRRLKAALDIDL